MSTLRTITLLAEQQIEAEQQLTIAEKQLESAKSTLRQISEVDLPEAMREANVKTFTLDNGFKIVIKDDVNASISKANKEFAHKWLRDNGFGGLIKTEVITRFSREELELARALAQDLVKRYGADRVEVEQSVHAQTLKAWLRERLEAADPVPLELFGAHFYSYSKITEPKK